MSADLVWLLFPAILLVAALYASVGHAGASGYIAVMALASVAPAVLRPTALMLNILVASIGTWQFARAGHFSWRLFWPFTVAAIPASFLGGYLTLPTTVFKALVGIVLLVAALNFLFQAQRRGADASAVRAPPVALAVPTGAGLGFFAGITGTGGGIFLTPLLLIAKWATPKSAAGVSAPFILANSIAGLAGNLSATRSFPALAIPLLVAAAVGGFVGSLYGSRRFSGPAIQRALAAVLIVAGLKLILIG